MSLYNAWCQLLIADPTVFTVIDSYSIDLICPIRQGRRPSQGGKTGQDQGRWSVGITLCWLVNALCWVVAWDWDTMNVNDQRCTSLVARCQGHTIPLADYGFRDHDGVPANMKICKKGPWNERMCVETAWSLVTVSCDLKRIRHRVAGYIQVRLAFVSAMFNVLMDVFQRSHPDADPDKMSIAEFSL